MRFVLKGVVVAVAATVTVGTVSAAVTPEAVCNDQKCCICC